jgi:hypothetical protein
VQCAVMLAVQVDGFPSLIGPEVVYGRILLHGESFRGELAYQPPVEGCGPGRK